MNVLTNLSEAKIVALIGLTFALLSLTFIVIKYYKSIKK